MKNEGPNSLVLLLNSTYEPLSIVSWTRAFILYLKGKVEILETTDSYQIITASGKAYPWPSVVRLRYYVKIKRLHNFIPLTKENIYLRDNFTCAYCGRKYPKSMLTVDHVIPVSKGGEKSWTNLVTACIKCNNTKANRTPEEAGMKLLFKPYKPRFIPSTKIALKLTRIPDDWRPYLYMK